MSGINPQLINYFINMNLTYFLVYCFWEVIVI